MSLHDSKLRPIIRLKAVSLRSGRGSQLLEFSAALIIVIGILLPLIDLGLVPVRWALAAQMTDSLAKKLTLCESASQSYRFVHGQPTLAQRLEKLGGVFVDSTSLRMRASSVSPAGKSGDSITVELPSKLPAAWLPDGAKSPCTYTLELETRVRLSPAILLPYIGAKVPGLSTPVPVTIKTAYPWANFGRNPVTGCYFLNE